MTTENKAPESPGPETKSQDGQSQGVQSQKVQLQKGQSQVAQSQGGQSQGIQSQRQPQAGLSALLNKYFHHIDRGGTLGGEIRAGLLVFLLSVCGIFMNLQLIAKLSISGDYSAANTAQIAANGEIYANTYFISLLIAFLGSLLIGLIARLPLVQVSGLGLSTVMISLIGTGNGLTYANLLVICFFSSIVYAVLVGIPGLKERVLRAIPAPVYRALPAAAGVLLAYTAIQLTGIVSVGSSDISVNGAGSVLADVSDTVQLPGLVSSGGFSYASDHFHPMLLVSFLSVLLTFFVYLLYKRLKKGPYLRTLLTGTIFFLIASVGAVAINWKTMKFSLDSLWGRIWMIGGEDAMQYHLSKVVSNLSIGKIFKEGMDFSAYTDNGGSVVLLFTVGILTFLLMSLCQTKAVLLAASKSSGAFDAESGKEARLAYLCHAGANIAAPLIGACPVGVGYESYAGTEDGAKSGISSVVASLGFFLSLFVMIVPTIFGTVFSYDITFNMYGHYGTVMQLFSQCSFGVVNAVMVIVGLSMIKTSLDMSTKDYADFIPFIVTAAGSFFLSGIAYGAALGTIAYTVIKLTQISRPENGGIPKALKDIGIPSAVLCILSVILLFLQTKL